MWEFLSRHTNIDAINKRAKKGFLFTIGDNANIRKDQIEETIKRVIGDDVPGATRESLLEEVQKKFHVFHIMIGGEGNKDILIGKKMVISENSAAARQVVRGRAGAVGSSQCSRDKCCNQAVKHS